MNSIQVSKGSSSGRNGYESITGQIDVEYLKPDNDEGVTINLFGNTESRLEVNADANIHLDDKSISSDNTSTQTGLPSIVRSSSQVSGGFAS